MVTYEGGLRPHRLWFVREDSEGVAPSDPDWNLYSDAVNGFDPDVDPGVDPQMVLGDPDPQEFFAGTMAPTLTVAYDLQQKSGAGNTFVDGSGAPNDAATDGFQRNSDNEIQNTHTILRRMTQSGIKGSNTVNGSTSKDTRQYMVFLGAHPDPTLVHDPSEATPVGIEIDYTCEKAEIHQIDQPPDAGRQIAVKSTDSGDTSQTVTIQGTDDGDNAAEEDVPLNGTTLEDTDTSFTAIDAVELSAEAAGTVEVYEDDDSANDSVTQGDQLMAIKGQNDYDHGEGDLGAPALGTGSEPSGIDQPHETPHGTTINRAGGTALSEEVMTADIAASNNFTDDSRTAGPRPLVVAEGREATADVTITGETEYRDKITDALQTSFDNFVYDLDGGGITLDDAAVLEATHSEDTEQGYFEVDVSLRGQEVTLS
jgi:hypothetical protein